jgi:hypothetical protein
MYAVLRSNVAYDPQNVDVLLLVGWVLPYTQRYTSMLCVPGESIFCITGGGRYTLEPLHRGVPITQAWQSVYFPSSECRGLPE